MHEIEGGGVEAFAHYLQSLDVSGFVPWRDVPRDNDAKRAMIELSINPYERGNGYRIAPFPSGFSASKIRMERAGLPGRRASA